MVILLTMQRRGQLALAQWDEFDLARKRWTIPAAHTKKQARARRALDGLAIAELKALKKYARDSRFVLAGKHPNRPAIITRGVQRLLPRFLAHDVEAFTPHDLRRTGRMTLGRLGVTPFIAERVINQQRRLGGDR